jgi:ornithine cyclodeaminase
MNAGALLYDGTHVAAALPPRGWIAAARRAFLAAEPANAVPPLAIPLAGGSAHVKAGVAPGRPPVLCVKLNVNLPGNPRRGLPTIQGLVLACDAARGTPLALLDSSAVTAWRTAAASVLAWRTLRRGAPRLVAIVGCGVQGDAHARLLRALWPRTGLHAFDVDAHRSLALPRVMRAASAADAVAGADFVVCATTSREPWLDAGMLRAGALVAAVGADHAGKRELRDAVTASAAFVVDRRAQVATMGEWRHAPATRRAPPELGELLRGERGTPTGRVTVFDSTGFGLQDAFAVAAILRRPARGVPRFAFA